MFKLVEMAETTFWWRVVMWWPADGAHQKVTFRAQFNLLGKDEIDAALVGDDDDDDATRSLAHRALCGWEGVGDADGEELPFNDANKNKLLNLTPALKGVMEAYLDAVKGKKAKSGN